MKRYVKTTRRTNAMKFMDVVVAVLAKLRDQENPFVCEEEIEDLYCMRMWVLDEIKRRHKERTKSAATKAADSHDDSVTGETGQDRAAGGQEEFRRDHVANEIAPGIKKPSGKREQVSQWRAGTIRRHSTRSRARRRGARE